MPMSLKIIIPVYKSDFSFEEILSFKRIYYQLSNLYKIVVVKPFSLDLSDLTDKYPEVDLVSFPDEYFRGIAGYNRLMLSPDFYKAFLDVDYILISQLDTYIFRDDLTGFLEKGYDYWGAPWIERDLYRFLPFLKKIKYSRKKYSKEAIKWKQNTENIVGNGGLSLRRVRRFYEATLKYADRIRVYNSNPGKSLFNEDRFWAHEPEDFIYPPQEEALRFSFDKYPAQCFRETNAELPFGCHGWNKWKWRKFWEKHIDVKG